MLFVETRVFTRELQGFMSDDDYRALQSALLLRPEAGAIIPGVVLENSAGVLLERESGAD